MAEPVNESLADVFADREKPWTYALVTIDGPAEPDYYVVIPHKSVRALKCITNEGTHEMLQTLRAQSKDEGYAKHFILTFPLFHVEFECSVNDGTALDKEKPWTFIPKIVLWAEYMDLGLEELTCSSGDPDDSYIWDTMFELIKNEQPKDGTPFEVRFVNIRGKTITTDCVNG